MCKYYNKNQQEKKTFDKLDIGGDKKNYIYIYQRGTGREADSSKEVSMIGRVWVRA